MRNQKLTKLYKLNYVNVHRVCIYICVNLGHEILFLYYIFCHPFLYYIFHLFFISTE